VSSTSLALYTTVSGDISSSTTWLPGVYVINGTVNITSGARLNINRDAVIKCQTSASKLVVAGGGILDAEGTASSYIYFTSYKDDSVGGDTNADTTSTTSAAGDWDAIQINLGASSTVSYAVIRYGGSGAIPTNIYAAGGSLTLLHSEIATGTTSGIYASGTSTVTIVSSNVHHFSDIHGQGYGMKTASTPAVTASSTNFHDNLLDGIYLTGTSPTLTLTGNQFSNNTTAAVSVDTGSGPTFTHSGNTACGTGYRGFS
jgi:parallel beta helix pectate lyase-like protein